MRDSGWGTVDAGLRVCSFTLLAFPRLLLYFRKPQSTYFYSDSKIVIHMAQVKLTRHCRA